ncbi:MAG: DUF5615 family PIN-like protein [Candidatus Nanopelagicales bacterium]
MRLALDHHYSPRIAEALRGRGHDARSILERGWQAEDDESLLALCSDAGRALLTNNVADFMVIARQWQAEGRSHAGLVLTSDAGRPRTRASIGRFVVDLGALMAATPGEGGLADRVHWL